MTVRTNVLAPVTPQVVVWAREQAGLTQTQLADMMNLPVEKINGWETAASQPSRQQLDQLAAVLKRPTAMFFLPNPPNNGGLPMWVHDDAAIEYVGRLAVRQAIRFQQLLSWVLAEQDFPGCDLPVYYTDERAALRGNHDRSMPAGVPVRLQLEWDPEEAFESWRNYVEGRGVIVMQPAMDHHGLAGFATWNDHAPLVAVNADHHPTVRISALFHGLARLHLRTPGMCDLLAPKGTVGDWCNQYATAFLLPGDIIRSITGPVITDPANMVQHAATRLSVPPATVAVRLRQLGVPAIVPLYSPMREPGSPPPVAQERIARFGTWPLDILLAAADQGLLTVRDLTDHLDVTTRQLDIIVSILTRPEEQVRSPKGVLWSPFEHQQLTGA